MTEYLNKNETAWAHLPEATLSELREAGNQQALLLSAAANVLRGTT